MSNERKYYGAIEIKAVVSHFLRHLEDVRMYAKDCDEEKLNLKFNEALECCKELFEIANEIATTEKPPEREVKDPDRGINEFLSSRNSGCNGGCGSCGGGCNP